MKTCSTCGHEAEFGFVCVCDECSQQEQKEIDIMIKKMNKQEELLLEIYKTIDSKQYNEILKKIKKLNIPNCN